MSYNIYELDLLFHNHIQLFLQMVAKITTIENFLVAFTD